MSLSQNSSSVYPEYFFIIGLSGIHNSNYYYMFLCITYFVTVTGNSLVLLLIALYRSLHSPKYIGVFNLALADFGETNALIPNMMRTFLFDSQYISYNACLANMFFVHFFSTVQSFTLVVLSYDRFIAIFLPLRYHAIVNYTFMYFVFSIIWVFNASIVAFAVSLITRLSFCESNKVNSYYCDYGPVYRLACNDNSICASMAQLSAALYVVAPVIIIVLSYLGIFLALSKITTWEGRLKALKTCVSHLLLVGSFFLPIICIFIATSTNSLSLNARVISTSLAHALPPMLHPIIYVLNTAEIKDIIIKIVRNKCLPVRKNILKLRK
uniref:Odorant receptor n=1 Tax=Danio rerio TaxID=7955 RepID=Q2PRC6_DANRE|nr:odorant receptor, family D, subfamily 111, member 8 isoform X1 [Danio rerio]ABC43341.1 odorant receptor [Danio rerio]|eukprot:XP_009289963.1 odorant receptor, family D, subfamily 111, member 8 isoform X1 [Danio rerio]